LVEGSLKAISYSVNGLDNRISKHSKEALAYIMKLLNTKIIIETEKFLELIWTILYHYLRSLEYANGTDDQLVKTILDPYFLHIGTFIEKLFTETRYTQLIDVKRISISVLVILFRDLSNYTAGFIPRMFSFAWQLLSAYSY